MSTRSALLRLVFLLLAVSGCDYFVSPVNPQPIAGEQAISTPEDTPATVSLSAKDLDSFTVSFRIVSEPKHGVLSGTGDTRTYTPNPQFNGADSFAFQASDGKNDSDVTTVAIRVTPVNDAPEASGQSVTVNKSAARSLTLEVADPDTGDTFSYSIVDPPSHGTLSGTAPNLTFTPTANYVGSDSFRFKVNDGTVDSNLATVALVIGSNNTPPVSNNAVVITNEDTPKAITLGASDAEDALSYRIVTGPANGILSGSGSNRVYTPNANWSGVDSFTFQTNDGTVDSNLATVTITVNRLADDVLVGNSWPFDALSEALYAFNASWIQFTGGVAELIGSDQSDNSSGEFDVSSGAQLSGVAYGTLSDGASGLKLGTGDSCDGTTTACAHLTAPDIYELHSSWTPRWANVVGYWKLNGATGTVADSSSGGTITGTVSGGVTQGAWGKIGKAAMFDGSSGQITLSAAPLSGSGSFSMHAWVKTSTTGARQQILSIGNGSNTGQGAWFYVSSTNKLQFDLSNTGGPSSTATVADGNWHHVAVTNNAGTIQVYVDGSASGASQSMSPNLASNAQVIGKGLPGWNWHFSGLIDDVAVWNTSLTAAEIQALYERQVGKYSGIFVSRVMDGAVGAASWTTLSWLPTLPFLKELPDAACAGATCAHANNENSSHYSSLVGSTGLTGANDLMSGIAGLWHLNESSWNGTAGEVKDASGKANHGTAVNGATTTSSGKLRGAGTFNGSSHHVLGTIAGSTVFAGNFTMSAWINHRAVTQWAGIFSNSVGTNETPILTMRDSTTQIGMMRVGVVDSGVFVDLGADHYNKWIFVSVRRNGGTLYVDAWKDGTKISNSGALNWTLNTTNSFFIGRHYQGATQVFNGLIDEVAVWSRSLTNAELKQLYQRGASRLKYQVRSCATNPCTAEAWKGPDGTSGTYFSELNNNSVPLAMTGNVKPTPPSMLFSAFTSPPGSNRYFQYRTIFETDSAISSEGPELKSVTVDPVRYPLEASIAGNQGVDFFALSSFTESLGAGDCSSGVVYNLGLSSAGPWKYWNGSAWVNSNGTAAQANPAAMLHAQVSSFGTQVGIGSVYFKAFLKSSGTSKCELNQVTIGGGK